MDSGEMKILLNHEQVVFNICRSMKQPRDLSVVSIIDVVDEKVPEVLIKESYG